MKQLIIKIEMDENRETSISTEKTGFSLLEVIGLLEQTKLLIMAHKADEVDETNTSLDASDKLKEEKDNVIPLT